METSNATPQVDVSNVELTCTHNTNDVVNSYEWFKDNEKINGASKSQYQIPDKKTSNSGSYQCKVFATNVPPSPKSDAMTVTFLCKFVS